MILKKNKRNILLPNSNKAISLMISYVLLITFAIIMGGLIYQWMKTYVPKDSLECPDGVSVFIKEVNCAGKEGNFQINLTLRNNGLFDVAGYFIHGADDLNQELATIDLSEYIIKGGNKFGSIIKFSSENENSMKPNTEKNSIFYLTNQIYLIEIIPVRFQTEDNKKRIVACGNAKIKEVIVCE